MCDRHYGCGALELDDVRRTEFVRLDRGPHVYLGCAGGGLYAQSQLREHRRLRETSTS